MSTAGEPKKNTSSLDSSHPVLVPYRPELFYPADKFLEFALNELRAEEKEVGDGSGKDITMAEGLAETDASWDILSKGGDGKAGEDVEMKEDPVPKAEETPAANVDLKLADPFISSLLNPLPSTPSQAGRAPENITLTTNNMPAYASTLTPTLDLFSDLQADISPAMLHDLLTQSWNMDPLETLKIIFQCRSIHLGKGEKDNFYRCVGWLCQNAGLRGKATVIANLEWVVQRTILKPKKKDTDTVGKIVEKPDEEKRKEAEEQEEVNDPVYSHGYWKDLANILVLEVQDSLTFSANVHDHRGEETRASKSSPLTREEKLQLAKAARHAAEKQRHDNFLRKFDDSFYMLLHLATARAFATQLHADLEAVESLDKARMRKITFAAKWAPSLEGQHDKHTFLASSIAEILFPPEHKLCADLFTDREGYLKLAREQYRRVYLSPLRKHLRVVERDVTAGTFDRINYNHVPSLAMNRYKKVFSKKDTTRFMEFLKKVAEGKAKISGSILTPSTLVHRAKTLPYSYPSNSSLEEDVERQIIDGQWNSLVKSVKERGILESAIAVVDVSGSMSSPVQNDRTCPMDSAIGLGMLLAEVAEEPFKGIFITFSEVPELARIQGVLDDRDTKGTEKWDFVHKVRQVQQASWGMNTNFLAVFEELLLPRALAHKVPPEKMVKKIFVFSDMQFDAAEGYGDGDGTPTWETGYERLKRKYEEAGYELPTMVYWNLASTGSIGKPVTRQQKGVVMMAGGGAGTMKAFLADLGGDEYEDEDEKEEEEEEEDIVMVGKKKKKLDPVEAMRKLLANPAYEGLKIVG
ncbi:hypothetical protein L211DRAFT_822636 [Terfezia boudieri ATCC MYA-4762]|uniref:Uncharacterized protein n=1 Tax=Terfezia boudieri ATCC MYA-4762 TaxID=1051890 RepID=A0A3N4M4F2_9PEZI|nr:hypothetical protein L211DRAFT_822636 [Terfezia boudieri ATCC MYA-4762]